MLDLAPSGFRDIEDNYDSEELEGIENIVHPDNKPKVSINPDHLPANLSCSLQKQVKPNNDVASNGATDEGTVDNLKTAKERKKKEKVKGRNEKKSLQGSDAITISDNRQSDTTAHATNTTDNITVQQVNTTVLLQQASVAVASLQNTSDQNSMEVTTQEENTDNYTTETTTQPPDHSTTGKQSTEQKRSTQEQNTEHNATTEEQNTEQKRTSVDKYTSQKSSRTATTDVRKTSQRQTSVEITSQVTSQKAQEMVINQSDTTHISQQLQATSSSAAGTKTKQSLNDQQEATSPTTISTQITTQLPPVDVSTKMSHNKTANSVLTTTNTQTSSEDMKTSQMEMQATMEQAIAQITSPTATKSTHTTYKQQVSVDQNVSKQSVKDDKPQDSATTKPAVPKGSKDESDSNLLTSQPSANQKETQPTHSDDDFSALLNELQNLSGSFDISIGNQQQSTNQFQTLSLFSDVPIVAPPRSSVISSTGSTDSSKEVTKQDRSSAGISTTKSVEVTTTKSTVTPTPTKPAVVTKPSLAPSKPPTATATPIKPITPAVATSTPAGHTSVPVAVSHKKEIKQQSDGTDVEWGIDFNDIDMDLASELEELNSILGQLGGQFFCVIVSMYINRITGMICRKHLIHL